MSQPKRRAAYEDLVQVSDLGAWSRERTPAIPSVAYFTLVPDWVRGDLAEHRSRRPLAQDGHLRA